MEGELFMAIVLKRALGRVRINYHNDYDATYLELPIREGVPLATLDKDLIKAAKKADIGIYLKA